MDRGEILKDIDDFRKKHYDFDRSILSQKRTYESLDDLEGNLETSQFRIDLQGYRFECLFYEKKDCENLYVIYDGAKISPDAPIPAFPRWGYHNLLPGSMLCIEDPMYYLYPKMKLGWYYGNKDVSLITLSLQIIKSICHHLHLEDKNVIFFSSSGGGYAGIYAASQLDNAMAIALNPQIYIHNFLNHSARFKEFTGFDLGDLDALHRNDLSYCIKHSTSKFMIVFNVQSEYDWDNQVRPFLEEMDINPSYGMVRKDNLLFWLYDAAGTPNPHTSFETKSIFLFIDDIAKNFHMGSLTAKDERIALIINECWHDIYECKKHAMISSKMGFIWLGRHVSSVENLKIMETKQNILLKKSSARYNFYRWDIPKGNRIYVIRLDNVKLDVPQYTAGVYDFISEKILRFEIFNTSEAAYFRFAVGENTEGIAFLFYSGIAGQSDGKEIIVGEMTVFCEEN